MGRCRALKPAGRPLPHCRGGNGPPSATRRLRGGGAVVDSKNIVCYVNSSACRVYVTSFYSTTSISFYKSFYTLRVLYTCNILAYTVRFKERVTREPNFSSSLKRVSRDHSLSSSLKEKVSRDHSLNPSL